MSNLEVIDREPAVPVEIQFSTKFCSPDSDISYTSTDNVRFLVHKQNLKVNATGFILPSEESTNTILPESTKVLETLFQFCYPDRHPNLMSLEFEDFVLIAEAAEKYHVHAATNICNVRMKRTLPNHAIEVMEYSARHNHPDLLAKTASLLLDVPMSTILPRLPSHLVIPWARIECFKEYFCS
ncbi:hypothetical protein BDZ94DRAFT_196979 [Collybia nuda]|uniref:BTB domain-containing protein n=1 Tax=Collybia nuda TaxID=64659 RepID=A0A9P5XXR3_9AGAR|nr:hypothetical protein BDZ94DRAFT_196979 [Collybia nuda]